MAGIVENKDPLEPMLGPGKPIQPEREEPTADEMLRGEQQGYGAYPEDELEDDFEDPDDVPETAPSEGELIQFMQANEPRATEYFSTKAQKPIEMALRAARNEHPAGSRYQQPYMKARARYHRPKTRSALKRVQTAAANALFATDDVVQVGAGDDSNTKSRANARLMKSLVNYRLSSQNHRNAVPWFRVAIGARTEAYLTSYCVSLQTWEYRTEGFIEIQREEQVPAEPAPPMPGQMPAPMAVDENGQPIQPMMTRIVTERKPRVVVDRPSVELFPVENVGIDPAAPWEDPAQRSTFLFLKKPAYKNDVEQMMRSSSKTGIKWKSIDAIRGAWDLAKSEDTAGPSMRSARDGSVDRIDEAGRTKFNDGNTLGWLYLWFINWRGVDYTFFSLGRDTIISEPVPTRQAFPWTTGRPVAIGTDVIAPHEIFPLSNAASVQPIQQEINDHANLRIDVARQSVAPIAKVRKGRGVDIEAVQRRGPNTLVMVEDVDDVQFEAPPGPNASAYQEMDRLNMDFDESAGIFSTSSVQANGQLNRTVGGMQILSGDAQATSSMELKVWAETWVEPVIRQIVELEQYYESDSVILSIAGAASEIFERFGIDTINDELLQSEVKLTVDIGTGSTDPMMRMQKFKGAWDTAGSVLAADMQSGRVKTKPTEIIDQVFGDAGFKDAGKRFFEVNDQPGPSPEEVQQLQQQVQELQAEVEKLKAGAETQLRMKQMELDFKREELQAELSFKRESQQMEIDAGIRQQVIGGAIQGERDTRQAETTRQIEDQRARNKIGSEAVKQAITPPKPAAQGRSVPTGGAGAGGGATPPDAVLQALQAIAQQLQQQGEAIAAIAQARPGPADVRAGIRPRGWA